MCDSLLVGEGMPRQKIALFSEMLDFDDTYMDLVWQSTNSRAIELDAHLLACIGRRIDGIAPEDIPHTLLFSLALMHDFSAYVVSQTVFHQSPNELIDLFGKLMANKPAAVASFHVDGMPTVEYDNKPALRDLMRHLIHDHGYTRILVVTGQMYYQEARERYQVWLEEMQKAGLGCGPEMVIEAHFHPSFCPGTLEKVYERIQQTGAQAMVVCTDMLASYLTVGLTNLGVRIPEDLAITGYDDIMMARFINPPITTVRQPIAEQYRAVIDIALARGQGKEYGVPNLTGKVVIRGSCGCPVQKWAEETQPITGNPELKALESLRHITKGQPIPIPELRASLAAAHDRTRYLRLCMSELNLFARQIDMAESIEDLSELLKEWLPRLGVQDFMVSLTSNKYGKHQPLPVNLDHPVVASQGPGYHKVLCCSPDLPPDEDQIFQSKDLVPTAWLDSLPRSSLLVLPLTQGNTWYGMIAMVIGREGNLMCRAIQEQTSTFLDRVFRLHAMVLKNMEVKIGAQMEAEKIQSISTFIAGVAHDMANPLGVTQMSAEYIQDSLTELSQDLAAGNLTQDRIKAFIEDSQRSLSIIATSAERAISQVRSFKRVSAEVPREDVRTINLTSFLRDILKNLEPMWRKTKVAVSLHGPDNLEVSTHASVFLDILTNLLQNSLTHAWPDQANGHLKLEVATAPDQPGWVRLCCNDDGQGIPAEVLPRIFEPFFTTREGSGGTGLGLYIVKQRVEDQLKGRISCESTLGAGTRFLLDFPKVVPV